LPLLVSSLGSFSEAGMVTRRWGTPPKGLPRKADRPLPKPPTGYVVETKTSPEIDGKLTDKAWARALGLQLARTLDGSARAPQPTVATLLRDKSNLYVAFCCKEPLLSKLKGSRRGHDGAFWNDDSVEVFLGVAKSASYYHFGFTASGSTYDARVKDASWDSGTKVAVAKGEREWTVEAAIPLEKLVGKGKPPESWIANFTRNRYTAGRWEESAWSPTFSGDSHVPARFGKLFFKEPPPDARPLRQAAPRQQGTVEILPCEGGEGLVRFDLSALPKRAKIHRAGLLIFRTAAITGANEEALVDIEISPLFSEFAAGGRPRVTGKPLALRGPWFDRFDATEAVQQWASGKTNGGFFVKTCPLWHAAATCLDVAYEGEPKNVPPQASGLKVFHRAGQTFVTWKEVDPLITTEKTTWGEIKRKLAEARVACRYRIYAHREPITASNLDEATLLGEVGPLSAYNVNARNKEYLIGQAMIQSDEMGELAKNYNGYMHTWHMDHPRMDRYPVQRFVIDEKAGPLPVGTGLYVHHPASPGRRCYAVVSVRDGVENTRDLSEANALQRPVEERVGAGEPVRQGRGLWGPFFDYPGTRWVYVQWCAPPLSPRPNLAFNWSVLLPPKVEGKVPAELYFHPDGYSYAQPGKKMLLGSIQIAPHDYPSSGWFGFNDAWRTLKSYKAGTVHNHTQKRIIAFLDWAAREFPIDPNRILAVGADGAAGLALAYPERFAYVLITGFDRRGVLEPKAAGRFAAAWGAKSPAIKDEKGRKQWRWAHLDELVLAAPARDLPLFVCRGASWGGEKGWGKGRGRFYRAMHRVGQPLVAHWAWGGRLQKPDKHTGLWRGVDIRRDTPIPAFSNCSLDQEGEGGGNTNLGLSWKDIKDRPESFEVTILCRSCTFDVTPRRLQKFKIKPGEKLRWVAAPLLGRRGAKAKPRSGHAEADAHGVATIRGLAIPRNCPGLKLRITRAK